MCLALRLEGEEFFDGFYEAEEAVGLGGQGDEIVAEIEVARLVVFGVNDHGGGGHFAAMEKHAMERIKKQQFADAAPAEVLADGQPAEQGGRDAWVAGDFFRDDWREIAEVDDVGRQSVKAGDRFAIRGDDKGGRDVFADVLSSLLLQVAVERVDATRKSRSIVGRSERFDAIGSGVLFAGHAGFTRDL